MEVGEASMLRSGDNALATALKLVVHRTQPGNIMLRPDGY